MTVREAMDIINGALDSLYEYYGKNDEAEFDEIGLAEAVLEKLVQKEESKLEKYCLNCGARMDGETE